MLNSSIVSGSKVIKTLCWALFLKPLYLLMRLTEYHVTLANLAVAFDGMGEARDVAISSYHIFQMRCKTLAEREQNKLGFEHECVLGSHPLQKLVVLSAGLTFAVILVKKLWILLNQKFNFEQHAGLYNS